MPTDVRKGQQCHLPEASRLVTTQPMQARTQQRQCLQYMHRPPPPWSCRITGWATGRWWAMRGLWRKQLCGGPDSTTEEELEVIEGKARANEPVNVEGGQHDAQATALFVLELISGNCAAGLRVLSREVARLELLNQGLHEVDAYSVEKHEPGTGISERPMVLDPWWRCAPTTKPVISAARGSGVWA